MRRLIIMATITGLIIASAYCQWVYGAEPPSPTSEQIRTQMFQELLTLHNEARAKAKLPLLVMDDALTRQAQSHANDMALFNRAYYFGLGTNENVGHGYQTAKEMHAAWMKYERASKVVLGPYKVVGFGEAGGYWCARYR